jgi:hypothetical protein
MTTNNRMAAENGIGGHSGPTLTERAEAAARAELRGDRAGMLGVVGAAAALPPLVPARSVPERWSLIHILSHFQ